MSKEIQRLSPDQKLSVAVLTKTPEWRSFLALVDVWKVKVMKKCLNADVTDKDVISLQAQCRMMVYLKTLEKRFQGEHTEGIQGSEDPALNIQI